MAEERIWLTDSFTEPVLWTKGQQICIGGNLEEPMITIDLDSPDVIFSNALVDAAKEALYQDDHSDFLERNAWLPPFSELAESSQRLYERQARAALGVLAKVIR